MYSFMGRSPKSTDVRRKDRTLYEEIDMKCGSKLDKNVCYIHCLHKFVMKTELKLNTSKHQIC